MDCAHHFVVCFTLALRGIIAHMLVCVHHSHSIKHIVHTEIPRTEITGNTTEATPKAYIFALFTCLLLLQVFDEFFCLTYSHVIRIALGVALHLSSVDVSTNEQFSECRKFFFVELNRSIVSTVTCFRSLGFEFLQLLIGTSQLTTDRHISRLSIAETLHIGNTLACVPVAKRGDIGFLYLTTLGVILHLTLCGLPEAEFVALTVLTHSLQTLIAFVQHLLCTALHLCNTCTETHFVLFSQCRLSCRLYLGFFCRSGYRCSRLFGLFRLLLRL